MNAYRTWTTKFYREPEKESQSPVIKNNGCFSLFLECSIIFLLFFLSFSICLLRLKSETAFAPVGIQPFNFLRYLTPFNSFFGVEAKKVNSNWAGLSLKMDLFDSSWSLGIYRGLIFQSTILFIECLFSNFFTFFCIFSKYIK